MGKLRRALGLMSGTSMDGIDVALLDTDGDRELRHGPAASYAYPTEIKVKLRAALAEAKGLSERASRPGSLGEVERALTELNAEAVDRFLRTNGVDKGQIDIIGYHGQTVLHDAPRGLTVQLGDGRLLAERTGIDVVFDLRAADVAAGGQGAPLVPVYHRALAAQVPELPAAFLNIGGVANVTWIGRDGRMLAFDTGPGNALLDDWVLARTGAAHDAGGALAARGRCHDDVLQSLLTNAYFGKPPPKSLDRNDFSSAALEELSLEDGAATLTAFTAAAIGRAREHMPEEPRIWVVCGGGRKNKTLMAMIAARVQNAVVPAEALGLDGDFIEAEAWAYLAVRSALKLPITFPETTGAPAPMTGGVLLGPR
ncbi:MAG: anhydro-N-acetylmuramic acid kinase [Hyphomicrobium sp.]|uniref:anhydro-N-acetylmuramic acid kinase n=1 Tax=Hyphomicrobium sp. TaxID=82 RepID=UPI0025C41DDD|nr:anhydro-N-acetylmuramic acid kinase [Hyphomicrobium sp.]MBZ0209142.1 anhydro-N-acetylmuramic acid kinase [Hyphomicrobium sp.]